MKLYEYRVIQYRDDCHDTQTRLTDLGLAGWRIKKIAPSSNPNYIHHGLVFMEREAVNQAANEQKVA